MSGGSRRPPGELERRFRLDGVWRWSRDALDDRLLLREYVDGRTMRIWLADLDVAEIVQIEPPGGERLLMAAYLADGRMILQSEDGQLWLATRDGTADESVLLRHLRAAAAAEHRFPMDKYRLLRERGVDGRLAPASRAARCRRRRGRGVLPRVHDAAYLDASRRDR